MNSDAHTDPLKGLFQPVAKSRFADLKWQPWDGGVFHRTNEGLEDSQELAFFAGTVHIRRAASLDRPDELTKLVDRTMLNFLAGWGISGFFVGRTELLRMIEGHETLLDSFRAGVLHAIGKLRDATVAEGVDENEFKELVDAMEAFAHKQYFDMAQLGAEIKEAIALEDVLDMFDAVQIVGEVEEMMEKEKAEAKVKADAGMDPDGPGDTQEEGGIEAKHEDHKDPKDLVEAAEDTAKIDDENKYDIMVYDEDSDTNENVVLLFELKEEGNKDEGRGKNEAVSGGGGPGSGHADKNGVANEEGETKKNSKAEDEHASTSGNDSKSKDQPDGERTSPKHRGKRAKSKKAKKAKKQAKRTEKEVKYAQRVENDEKAEDSENGEVDNDKEVNGNEEDNENVEHSIENMEDDENVEDNETFEDAHDVEDTQKVD